MADRGKLLFVIVLLVACKKPPPPAPKADAAAVPAFPVASTNASAARDVVPWEGLLDPEYVAVGELFTARVKKVPDCKPNGDWEPAGLVVKQPAGPRPPSLDAEAFERLPFRATEKGTAKLHALCGTTVVTKREVTILDPEDVAPYADLDAGAYGEALAPMLEEAREAAAGCFAAELGDEPRVRGAGRMVVRVDPNGDVGVPRGSAHYGGAFDGLSPMTAHCVRTAMVAAGDKQRRVDVKLAPFTSPQFAERGATIDVRFRFEVRPKKNDATSCKRYAERWKACAKAASTAANDTHTTIVAREKLAKTDAARTALGWKCATALRDLGTTDKCAAD